MPTVGRPQKRRGNLKGFAAELEAFRKREGLTLEQLAVRADVRYMSVYRWLEGRPISKSNEFMVRERLGLPRRRGPGGVPA